MIKMSSGCYLAIGKKLRRKKLLPELSKRSTGVKKDKLVFEGNVMKLQPTKLSVGFRGETASL